MADVTYREALRRALDEELDRFQGLVTEEGILELIEYIKSLGPKPASGPVPPGTSIAGSTPGNR